MSAAQLKSRVEEAVVSNPKLTRADRLPNGWRFYPAFSFDFANKYLERYAADQHTVLDAWNGSGTTTAAAAGLGIKAIGLDLNPAMRVLARSRVAGSRALWLACAVSKKLPRSRPDNWIVDLLTDPLSAWFSPSSVLNIRCLQTVLTKTIYQTAGRHSRTKREEQELIDDLSSVFATAMFAVVRETLDDYLTSNPTWIRIPKNCDAGVEVLKWPSLRSRFVEATNALVTHLSAQGISDRDGFVRPKLGISSSTALPLRDSSISTLVSSPPYGTRIDYAVATAFECAVLGLRRDNEFADLRQKLIGTTTVAGDGQLTASVRKWAGPTCSEFLMTVKNHPSHASATYYLKNWLGYFQGISTSLSEIHRVLRPEGQCTLVVQDSHYKEIRAPIQEIFEEMARRHGMEAVGRYDFRAIRSMGLIHPHANAWRDSSTATESVLVFKKRRRPIPR